MTPAHIRQYIDELASNEIAFKNQSLSTLDTTPRETKPPLPGNLALFYIRSLVDVVRLLLNKKKLRGKNLVYTARNFCVPINGRLEDRLAKSVVTADIVFINQSKEYHIDQISGQKVFNIGGAVKILGWLLYGRESDRFRYFFAYRRLNGLLLKGSFARVFTLCFYDLNGLSLVFSPHRADFELCEIQHGSIIHYPPYVTRAPIQVADAFFVKNERTIAFLKQHLCAGFDVRYALIPYPSVERKPAAGLHLLYASTVEFEGFHPVFKAFLANNPFQDLSLTIRLHPREKGREQLFVKHLAGVKYRFDDAPNWLESTTTSNTIVVSPWSSCIEDGYDNGMLAIIIDPVGKQRFQHLLDGKACFYTENLTDMLGHLMRLPNL